MTGVTQPQRPKNMAIAHDVSPTHPMPGAVGYLVAYRRERVAEHSTDVDRAVLIDVLDLMRGLVKR